MAETQSHALSYRWAAHEALILDRLVDIKFRFGLRVRTISICVLSSTIQLVYVIDWQNNKLYKLIYTEKNTIYSIK